MSPTLNNKTNIQRLCNFTKPLVACQQDLIIQLNKEMKKHADVIKDLEKLDTIGDQSQEDLLNLQNAMEMEARIYQTISNTMKTIHDITSSVIQNLR